MSFDVGLRKPNGDWYELTEAHHMKGGTYQMGGCSTAELNITYNYSRHFAKVLPSRTVDGKEIWGIRFLHGMTAVDSIPILEKAIEQLGDDVSDDYWEATEGNAKAALGQCLALAKMCPDGIWDVC